MKKSYRDATNGGSFSYNLATNNQSNLSLMVNYWGAEWGNRKFDIYIDDEKLITEDNTGRWNQSKFFDVEYAIPDAMLKDKASYTCKVSIVGWQHCRWCLLCTTNKKISNRD